MNNDEREQRSDQARKPMLFYVYMLDFGDRYYVGQTNDLEARLVEQATERPAANLVWFTQVVDRRAAKNLEGRIQRAVENDKGVAIRMVESFNRLLRVIRPEKTYAELKSEHLKAAKVAENTFHLIPYMGSRAACHGLSNNPTAAYAKYGAGADTVLTNERVYQQVLDATGDESSAIRATPMGRRSCGECVQIAEAMVA